MATPIDTWLSKKNQEIAQSLEQINTIKDIQKQLPDLSYSLDRWNHFRLHSAEVTTKAVEVDIRHSCGCCSDSTIFARPYVVMNGQQVFSTECFTIGEKGYDCEHPFPGWRSELLKAGVQQCIIDRIEGFFEVNKSRPDEEQEDPEPLI